MPLGLGGSVEVVSTPEVRADLAAATVVVVVVVVVVVARYDWGSNVRLGVG
jgi:hypothetical protein